jgi:hypothetical protein
MFAFRNMGVPYAAWRIAWRLSREIEDTERSSVGHGLD